MRKFPFFLILKKRRKSIRTNLGSADSSEISKGTSMVEGRFKKNII